MTYESHLNIAFRVDASIQIGTGHVMRCLTLADALRKKGANCIFISRKHIGNLINYIQCRGHKVIGLPSKNQIHSTDEAKQSQLPPHAKWLGTNWIDDARETQIILKDISFDWLIVDHYGIDNRWETQLRSTSDKIMVIDDLADRNHNCDLLLDQNLGRSTVDYKNIIPSNCKMLLGPKFALLRPEFAALREYSIKRRANQEAKHILISMGGIDKENVTSSLLKALDDCSLTRDIHIDVVMGKQAPWIDQVKKQCDLMSLNINVLIDTPNMAQIMAESDLAIGAAGTTAWERCSLGLPSLVIVLADNQKKIALELQKQGAAKIISDTAELKNIYPFITNKSQLQKMSTIAASVSEGCGTNLVQNNIER